LSGAGSWRTPALSVERFLDGFETLGEPSVIAPRTSLGQQDATGVDGLALTSGIGGDAAEPCHDVGHGAAPADAASLLGHTVATHLACYVPSAVQRAQPVESERCS
jgi:hypothetical protein